MFKSIKKLMQTIKDCDVTPDNNTEPEIVINVENSNKKAKKSLEIPLPGANYFRLFGIHPCILFYMNIYTHIYRYSL